MIKTSFSGEEIENSSCFLKGGIMTLLWNRIVNHVEVNNIHEKECRWQNAVIMIGNLNNVALITVCRIVDGNSVGVNSSKAQYEIIIGKVISDKTIRNKHLKKLSDYVKNYGATDVIVAGDFNESVGT